MLGHFIHFRMDIAVKNSHPIGQHTQRVAAVFEEAANGGQAIVRLNTALLQNIADPICQLGIVSGFQMLCVDPTQFGIVKLRRTAAQMIEVEPMLI